AFRARHRNLVAGRNRAGPGAGADNRGDAELAADDGRMARPAAAIGDDRRGALHHRLPVGIGHFGHEHLAVLQMVELGRRPDDARAALADLLADAAPGDDDLAALLEDETLEHERIALRVYGLRSEEHTSELQSRENLVCRLLL